MCRLWVVKGVRGNNTGHDESRIFLFPSSQQIKKQPSVLSSNRGVEDVDLGISGSPSVSICANPETRGVSGTHGYLATPLLQDRQSLGTRTKVRAYNILPSSAVLR